MMKFLQNNTAESLMRLMCFIAFVIGSIIALCSLFAPVDTTVLAIVYGSAFGGKVGQKIAESK